MAKAKTSNILVWTLLGLLIVSLLGFGVTNFGGSIRSVATVGDAEVDIERYGRELQNELRAISAQTGQAFTFAQAREIGIDRAVLSRLVSQAALENEVGRLGISVGDEVVSREIVAIPAFAGVDGQFDREAYQFTLESSGLSVAEFEERVRVDTSSGILQRGVIAGVVVPTTYTDTLIDYVLEERDITWARLTGDNLDEPIGEPSEDDLRTYHEANADAFTLPETRVITFAWITPDMIRDSIEIDADSLAALYQERIDEYVVPERRLVERLVFGDEAEAAEALAAIEAGDTSFDDLIATRGLTLDDVDLGDARRSDLGDAAEGVFALSEPGVVGPLPSSLGPALFRVNAILSPRETTLEDAEEELRAELAADRARRVIDDSITDYDDLLAGGATLEELADETDMELGAIDWRNDVTVGIAAYEAFRQAAGTVADGDFPEILPLEDGGVFALRLDEIRAPELQPLNAVRPQVIAGWEDAEVTAALTATAQSLAGQIAAGREMAGLDLPLETDRGLTRDGFVAETQDGFAAEVFDMEAGEVRVIEGAGQAFIVRLDDVRAPDPDDPGTQIIRQALQQQTVQELSDDILNAFANAAIAMAGVEVNQAAINAVHSQLP